jgi:hypothetical protein
VDEHHIHEAALSSDDVAIRRLEEKQAITKPRWLMAFSAVSICGRCYSRMRIQQRSPGM